MNQEVHQKVKTTHLKRNAYLYIRQSTLRQVWLANCYFAHNSLRFSALLPVPGELLILGDFRHFAIHGSRSARRSRSVHSVLAESVLGEYPRYPATRSFEAGDIKPGSGRHQAAAGV